MHVTEVVRRWLVVAAQVLGLGGTIYEAFWEQGRNPFLLKIFIQLLLGGVGASVPWRSLLAGFRFRFEIREPQAAIPTLLIDLGTLPHQPETVVRPVPITVENLPKAQTENLQQPLPPTSSGNVSSM